MNDQWLPLSFTLSAGLSLLAMMAEAVGFLLCLGFRHLSGWTTLVALGFAGLFTAGALSRLPIQRWLLGDLTQALMALVWVVGGAFYLLSMIALVGGLWMTFVDLQRRLAIALEPKDVWR